MTTTTDHVKKPYKVVTAWRYYTEQPTSSSPAPDVHIPWQTMGNVLFEMGASTVSVDHSTLDLNSGIENGSPDPSGPGEGRFGSQGGVFPVDGDGSDDGGRGARKAVLRFTVEGGRDVGGALKLACELAGADADCFGELDSDEKVKPSFFQQIKHSVKCSNPVVWSTGRTEDVN